MLCLTPSLAALLLCFQNDAFPALSHSQHHANAGCRQHRCLADGAAAGGGRWLVLLNRSCSAGTFWKAAPLSDSKHEAIICLRLLGGSNRCGFLHRHRAPRRSRNGPLCPGEGQENSPGSQACALGRRINLWRASRHRNVPRRCSAEEKRSLLGREEGRPRE